MRLTMRFVFDFAGVLFHWQPLELLQRVLQRRQVAHQISASTRRWAATLRASALRL